MILDVTNDINSGFSDSFFFFPWVPLESFFLYTRAYTFFSLLSPLSFISNRLFRLFRISEHKKNYILVSSPLFGTIEIITTMFLYWFSIFQQLDLMSYGAWDLENLWQILAWEQHSNQNQLCLFYHSRAGHQFKRLLFINPKILPSLLTFASFRLYSFPTITSESGNCLILQFFKFPSANS